MVAAPRSPVTPKPPSALEAAIAHVRSSHDFPAVAGRIQQLMAVLGEEDASVQQLANIIVQDYSLTVKLLRVANSFKFNRSSAPVMSATHAIVMMGAEAVRDLATTIVVWEHFRRRSAGLRPLLMLSLLSANHARGLAALVRTVGSEEAYLLGMMRNIGEVLVACYFPDQYAAVLNEIAERKSAPAIACRRVLHYEYEELGRAVMQEWGMPDSVSRTMFEAGGTDDLFTVVSFSHRLTTAVYRNGPESSHQAVTMLIQKYATLGLTREEVTSMLEAGIEGTRETFALAGVHLNELQLKQQMNAAIADQPTLAAAGATPAAAASPAPATMPAKPLRMPPPAPVAPEVDPAQQQLNAAVMGILQQALSGGAFTRAVLALVPSTRRELSGRLGAGEATESFVSRFRYPLGLTGGPIGMAASRAQELTLARTWELLPEEHRLLQSLDAGAFAMLPLVVEGRTVGALYVDTPRTVQVGEPALAALRHLRDAVVNALARHHIAA